MNEALLAASGRVHPVLGNLYGCEMSKAQEHIRGDGASVCKEARGRECHVE